MAPPHVLILAAGKGKRMKSTLPKVLHPVLGKPILHHIIDTILKTPHRSVNVVVGFGENQVRESCAKFSDVGFLVQKEQLGTGDAVKTAADLLAKESGDLLVLSGDVLLLRPETLEAFVEKHQQMEASCTVATAVMENPSGYGRIIREGEKISAIKEHVDCSDAELKISEINSGLYCFRISDLFQTLNQVTNTNKQKEYYLTDVPQILAKTPSKGVFRYVVSDRNEILGINDRAELSQVQAILQSRIVEHWWREGVSIEGRNVVIDTDSRLGKDVVVEIGARIFRSVIEHGAFIEADCRIIDSKIGTETRIKQGSYIEQSEVSSQCSVGPYAHLRPGSQLGPEVKIGNFVEIKKATFAKGSKASHLSYIGDASIGENSNLGCGFITCNYDGKEKHQTIIESDVFIGSDSQAVAPVKVGKGSYVASGSTITENVPPDSLVISRGKQVTKPGYAKKYKK